MASDNNIGKLLKLADFISMWVGKFAAWLIVALIGVVVWEVISRYVFNAPTSWAYEMSCFLYGSSFLLGIGYTLLSQKHVSIDTFSSLFSHRKKAFLSCFCYILFFFIVIPPLIIYASEFAAKACTMNEHSYSPWAPPLCYIKIIIPISFIILLIQGIADFIRKLVFALKGIEL